MSMTEQRFAVKAETRFQVQGFWKPGEPVHPIAELNQRFDFQFSEAVSEHDEDRRLLMMDYAREFGAPELAARLERLFNPPAPAAPVVNGFGLPAAVLDCLEAKFGS